MRQGGRPSVFTRQHHGRSPVDASAALGAAAFLGMFMVAAAIAAPAALAEETVSATPHAAAPGSEITVTAAGFPPLTGVELGAGPPASEYTVINHGQTDLSGNARFVVRLDDEAPMEAAVVFVVATEDLAIKAASPPVEITAPKDIPIAHLKGVPGS